jgi:hypothetical protein
MLIKFEDIRIGDEIIIPSNSKLKYLKVKSVTKSGSLKCSAFRGDRPSFWSSCIDKNKYIFQSDVSLHNAVFYLKNDGGYTNIWLVKRENND